MGVCLRLWCRLTSIGNNRLPRMIFLWTVSLPPKLKLWTRRVEVFLEDVGLPDILPVNISQHFRPNRDVIRSKLKVKYDCLWMNKVNSDTGSRNGVRNKLRTYRQFKSNTQTELYLRVPLSPRNKRALAKLRTGVAPLAIELVRHRGIPLEDRLCVFCDMEVVEEEHHFIMECPFYSDLREKLLNYASQNVLYFNNVTAREQMCALLSHDALQLHSAKILREFLDTRENYLYK